MMTEPTPAEIHAKARDLYPKVTRAYVDRLARPLVRYMSEPPHDPLTVLAVAVRGALYEALELIELGETGLRQDDGRREAGEPRSGEFAPMQHGQIYAATKVVHRVADALQLFRPGDTATPGERVLAVRSHRGLSQQQVADAAHCTRSHLSHVERGSKPLTRTMAYPIAQVLGVSADYLLTGEPGRGHARMSDRR